jgi:hypothetical protein
MTTLRPLAIVGGIALGTSAAHADVESPSAVVFLGAGLSEDAAAGFMGGVWAPAGFAVDGVFFRLLVNGGTYDFSTSLDPDGTA